MFVPFFRQMPDGKAVRRRILVFLTNCRVKILKDFIQRLRFVAFNIFFMAILCFPSLPNFAPVVCTLLCASVLCIQLKYHCSLQICPPFCFGTRLRLTYQSFKFQLFALNFMFLHFLGIIDILSTNQKAEIFTCILLSG